MDVTSDVDISTKLSDIEPNIVTSVETLSIAVGLDLVEKAGLDKT